MAVAPKGKPPGGAPSVAVILGGPSRKGGAAEGDDMDDEEAEELGDEEFVAMLETLLDDAAEVVDRRAAFRELMHACK